MTSKHKSEDYKLSAVEYYLVGSTIMNVAKYMIQIIDYKNIILKADADAIGFYEKQGFNFKGDGLFIKYKSPTNY